MLATPGKFALPGMHLEVNTNHNILRHSTVVDIP